VPITTNLVISVALNHARNEPPTFRVVVTNPLQEIHLYTFPFTTTGTPDPLVRNLVWGDNLPFESPAIPGNRRADVAVIYYHTHQAWQLAKQLRAYLDLKLPLDVVAYNPANGVFWMGPMTNAPTRSSPVILPPSTGLTIESGMSMGIASWLIYITT